MYPNLEKAISKSVLDEKYQHDIEFEYDSDKYKYDEDLVKYYYYLENDYIRYY